MSGYAKFGLVGMVLGSAFLWHELTTWGAMGVFIYVNAAVVWFYFGARR